MPNTFSKWIDKKLPITIGNQTPGLPTLPRVRPRVLTPSPSRENLILSAAAATANSAFFQKLPPEIRRKILKEAFGNYTMHMHLGLDFPKVPLDVRQRDPVHIHANVKNAGRNTRPQTKFGIPIRKKWQWWSSICHRYTPSTWPNNYSLPCQGECYTGYYRRRCEAWPGKTPGKCFIGVMGWLLSCRQSLVLIS